MLRSVERCPTTFVSFPCFLLGKVIDESAVVSRIISGHWFRMISSRAHLRKNIERAGAEGGREGKGRKERELESYLFLS